MSGRPGQCSDLERHSCKIINRGEVAAWGTELAQCVSPESQRLLHFGVFLKAHFAKEETEDQRPGDRWSRVDLEQRQRTWSSRPQSPDWVCTKVLPSPPPPCRRPRGARGDSLCPSCGRTRSRRPHFGAGIRRLTHPTDHRGSRRTRGLSHRTAGNAVSSARGASAPCGPRVEVRGKVGRWLPGGSSASQGEEGWGERSSSPRYTGPGCPGHGTGEQPDACPVIWSREDQSPVWGHIALL